MVRATKLDLVKVMQDIAASGVIDVPEQVEVNGTLYVRASSVAQMQTEVQQLHAALDMVAEEREAWKARAQGLPQAPCRHTDHPSDVCQT